MTEYVRQQLLAAGAPVKPVKAPHPPNSPPEPHEARTAPLIAPFHVGPWTIQLAPGVTGHRVVCQAGPEADLSQFLEHIKAYHP